MFFNNNLSSSGGESHSADYSQPIIPLISVVSIQLPGCVPVSACLPQPSSVSLCFSSSVCTCSPQPPGRSPSSSPPPRRLHAVQCPMEHKTLPESFLTRFVPSCILSSSSSLPLSSSQSWLLDLLCSFLFSFLTPSSLLFPQFSFFGIPYLLSVTPI